MKCNDDRRGFQQSNNLSVNSNFICGKINCPNFNRTLFTVNMMGLRILFLFLIILVNNP